MSEAGCRRTLALACGGVPPGGSRPAGWRGCSRRAMPGIHESVAVAVISVRPPAAMPNAQMHRYASIGTM